MYSRYRLHQIVSATIGKITGNQDVLTDKAALAEAIVTAIDAHLAQTMTAEHVAPPPEGSVWSHENGNTYTVLMITNADSTRADYLPTVVYVDQHGKRYSKPVATWRDKRTMISAGAAAQ